MADRIHSFTTSGMARPVRRSDAMTLLAIHNALYMLALAVASGFAGAYLLRRGIALPLVLLLYASFFLLRFAMRLVLSALVRCIGYRRTLIVGLVVIALQYLPLSQAGQPAWLALWLLCMSLGEVLYWPVYHAAVATAGSSERRGRQMGLQAALTAAASIAGPPLGGWVLNRWGAEADFGLGALIVGLAIGPILLAPEFPAGPVPRFRDTFKGLDPLGLMLFFLDGWISSGWLSIWSMIYFLLLGSHYEAFGLANAAAGLVGCVTSLIGGRWIDQRRGDGWHLTWVATALLASIALRVLAGWSPLAAMLANLTGIAVSGAYVPLLMSALYERAKRSDGAFRFHLALEGAWDTGGLAGHLAGALIVWCLPRAITMAVLPSALGVAVFVICMRRDRPHRPVAVVTE